MIRRILVAGLLAAAVATPIAWKLRGRANYSAGRANPVVEAQLQRPVAESAQKLNYRVLASFPHDRKAYTQGLVWHQGRLFEGTGQLGKSSLREVELKSGRVLRKITLAEQHFGEGVAVAGGQILQLTWQTGHAFVYDLAFKPLKTFRYEGEGWGLTYDGSSLIMSDGSDTLTYRNPRTFKAARKLPVTLNGSPVRNLNELEYIDGLIWANVWQTDYVLCIDPKTGITRSYLDLKGLLPDRLRNGTENVLNGIAYDRSTGRILVTGKLWPRIFEIQLIKA